MQSMIRFSLFGNFEKYCTSNTEAYVKLIEFFVPKGYKPSTANELILQPNGQVKVVIMPVFINDNGMTIEITSTRINFQKVDNSIDSVVGLCEVFKSELLEVMVKCVEQIGLSGNRLALNSEIIMDKVEKEMPMVSMYFDNGDKSEMNVRNAIRKIVQNETTNIIFEKFVSVLKGFTKYSYDINSNAENPIIRFDKTNIGTICEEYMAIALDIEKG